MKLKAESLSPDGLPRFQLEPISEDVKRILGKNGELNRIDAKPIHLVEHQLSWKCETCIYNECCFTRAIEGEDVSLLNLTRGEQNALRRHGIEKLEDLARLKKPLDPREQFPNNFKEIPAVDIEKVKELSSNPVIGRKLNHIIQRAQFMLGPIKPTSKFIIDRKTPPWITATGYGHLPEDSPPIEFNIDIGYPRGGLIRVYLHAQWDYMLDMLVMTSARISCTNYKGDSISISKIVESLPDQPQECVDSERRMLEGFFRELTQWNTADRHRNRQSRRSSNPPLFLYHHGTR
jgi:predicted RecB family nuclease